MAAAHSTGISSSPTDLLQLLVTWLVAQGWTSDASAAEGAGWRAHLHKNGLYLNFRTAMNEKIWPKITAGDWDAYLGYGLGLNLGDGYSGAAAWQLQPGAPTRIDGSGVGAGMSLPSGSVAAYHFFDDGTDHVTVVVEKSPGIFVHMGWGPSLVKTGYTDDFPYFFASGSAYRTAGGTDPGKDIPGYNTTAWSPYSHGFEENYWVHSQNFVRVDAATFPGRWVGDAGNEESVYGSTGRRFRLAANQGIAESQMDADKFPNYQFLLNRGYQAAFAGAVLFPLHAFVLTDPDARWAPVGYPPTAFWCEAVGNGYTAGEVYQVGGLDYMVFPHFAVRKVV